MGRDGLSGLRIGGEVVSGIDDCGDGEVGERVGRTETTSRGSGGW